MPVEERLQHRAFGASQRPFRPLNVRAFHVTAPIIPCSAAT